jgi:hypothetical protein
MALIRATLFALLFHASTCDSGAATLPLLGNDSPVRVFVPTDNTLGLLWTGANEPFDDSGWIAGQQGIGFDLLPDFHPFIGTDVRSAMFNVSATIYVRLPFNVANPSLLQSLRMSVDYDDGFAAYLNGVEFARVNTPAGMLTNQSQALVALGTGNEPGLFELNLSSLLPNLHAGENVLAFFALNNGIGESSDFLIRARLEATTVPEPPSRSMISLFAASVVGLRLRKRANLTACKQRLCPRRDRRRR